MSTIKERIIKEYWIEKAMGMEAYPMEEMKSPAAAYAYIQQVIPSDHVEKVRQLAGQNEIMEFVTYLSFYCILLNKYFEKDQIIVSAPAFKDGQNIPADASLNFFIVNIDDRDSVKDVLMKVKKEVIQTLNHQQYDFKSLKDHFERNRISLETIYQVGFSAGDMCTSVEFDRVSLQLIIDLDANQQLTICYDSAKFDKYFVDQMGQHFVRLITQGLENYDAQMASLTLLTGEERRRILCEFNNTAREYPKDTSMVALFEERATACEQRPALTCNDQEVTYGLLNKRANKLAHYLKDSAKLDIGDKVAVFLDRSDYFIVSLLGILKTGAIYAPIDPNSPPERIKYILQDLSPKAVITVSDHIFEFDNYNGTLVSIDIQEEAFEENIENINLKLSGDDPAYVMYTSGTTGKPKGVVVTQRNVVRLVVNTNYVKLDENASMIMTGSVAFDATTYEIWGALLNGAVLHILSNNDLLDGKILKAKVHDLNITHMWFTTSWFNQLVNSNLDLFSKLEYLIVGGEKSSPKYFNAVRELSKKIRICHVYGPTENTTFSTFYAIEKSSSLPFPIGKPIANSTVYIVDKNGEPVPLGVEGEICLGGDGVAAGYLNQPKLTADRFVPDRFQNKGFIYKSGDRGKWLPDGNIEFIGRKDNQIKLRGFRIELNEIANILNGHPDVSEATLVHINKEVGDGYLAAYLVCTKPVEEIDLKAYLKRYLPDYMIPAYFIRLDSIPLTTNGKIDKRALPDPEKLEAGNREKYEAPQGEIEEKLVEIWEKVLNQKKIGVHDNFFELGGHSLKATQVLMDIHQDLEVHLEIGDIFNNLTIRELAQVIVEKEKTAFEEIPVAPRQEVYDLSHGQHRLWILDQFEEEHKAYTIPRAFVLENIELAILEQAFIKIIQRHEILRTTFVRLEDEPRQKIQDPEAVNFKIRVVDIREAADQDEQVGKLSHKETTATFDLETGPLMNATLALLDDKRSVLFLTMHHIISDYWSSNVFFNEMQAFYTALSHGEKPALPPLRIQYKDYAAWQRQQLVGEKRAMHKKYWIEQLGDNLPQLQLPLDYTRPALKTTNGAAVDVRFPQEIALKLKQLNERENSTTFNTLLTVIYALLYRWSGQRDMVIGAPVVGRDHKDLAGQIGLYINTLPVRMNRLVDSCSFEQLLTDIKQVTIEALRHQMYPFDLVVEDLNIKKDPSRSVLFDVMVQIISHDAVQSKQAAEGDDVNIEGYQQKITTCSFDMIFDLVLNGDELRGVIKYNTDLFQEETVIILRERLSNFLEDILNHPEKDIDQLNFKTEQETGRRKVVLTKEFDF